MRFLLRSIVAVMIIMGGKAWKPWILHRQTKTLEYIIRTVIVVPFACTILPHSISAQVPTMDDYNLGSGTVVRKVKGDSSNIIQPSSSLPPFEGTTLSEVLSYLDTSLGTLSTYVQGSNWEDIVQTCKVLDAVLQQPVFGLDTEINSYLLLPKETAALDALREDLAYSIDQLRDAAVARRVYFFNRDDLTAVQMLSAEQKSSEITKDMDQSDSNEPQHLLNEARKTVGAIQQLVAEALKPQ